MDNFWSEIKRRNVIKATIAYLVVNWVLLQFLSILLPIVEAPDWVMKTLTLLMVLGFPIWVIISWVYEVTPEGLKKTINVPEDLTITAKTNKRLNILIIIALIVAIVFSFINRSSPIIRSSKTSDHLDDNSIAVLYFDDMSSGGDTEWFCDGVTEDILTNLSKIKGIKKVISRTSVNKYKSSDKTIPEIAKELGVSYIVEGSVRKHNDRVLITAQLISANDKHLWADKYNENLEDIFKIQQDVSKAIVEQLQIHISPEEEKILKKDPTNNIEAYQLFLKGRVAADDRTLEGLETSVEYYQKAIELDPIFAEAYAETANSYRLMGGYGQKNRDKINNYIEKAIEIDPNTVRAYTVKAMIYLADKNWEKSKEYFEKAITLNPNDAGAHQHFAYYFSGKPDRDIKNYYDQINIAQKLDPFSMPINDDMIKFLIDDGKIDEAEEHLNKVSYIFTDKDKKRYKQRIINKKCEIICLEKKDRAEAIKFYEKAIKEEPNNSFLYKELGSAYDGILNDDKNAVIYYKKAYQLDSTNISIAVNYNFTLIESGNFNEAKKLMETENYKSLIAKDREFFKIYNSYYYYYFKKDYKKSEEILSGTLKNEFYFDKICISAQLGKVDKVYKLLKDHKEKDVSNKAFIFAILQEKDSMYHYLNKEDIDFWWVNGRFEFDPYRKEERYKDFLKKNYLPITHWNE